MKISLVAALAVTVAACAGSATDPRPFGLEKPSVTLLAGEGEMVGFRFSWTTPRTPPSVTVTPATGGLFADINSFVMEEGAVAGGVSVRADLHTTPGAYSVALGDQTLNVVVAAFPPVVNDPKTTRRSTVAQNDRLVAGLVTMATVNEDGTVWQLLPDGGVSRLELLSGVTAVTEYGTGFEVATLDGPEVDVRATQSELERLHSDGTVQVDAMTVTDVAAIRPYFVGAAVQATFRTFLKKDGTVAGTNSSAIAGAVDVIPLGNTFLRADGVVFETFGSQWLPVFASPQMRELEGAAFETFAGQTAEYRHHSLWRAADGIAWGMPSDQSPPQAQPPRVLLTPPGVEVKDVFARGRGWYLLATDGRLYDATGGTVRPQALPFQHVRAAAAIADVGVFSDGISFQLGQAANVPLRVRRVGFDGPLTLSPRNLPADVTVAPVSIPAGASDAMLNVAFAAKSLVRPLELELSLIGEGLVRTTLLSIELPRAPRRTTVAKDLALKSDGTVWRFSPGPPVQIQGLSNIISITDNMALSASGLVYSFGDNSEGQLGRMTATASDPIPAVIPGLPPVVAVARCTQANNLSMLVDENGGVWRFGRAGTTGGFSSSTPVLMTGLPPMVDVNGDGSPAGLDNTGAVWLLNRNKSLGGQAARIGLVFDGMPATVDQNYSIPANGRIGRSTKVLWYNSWATLTNNTVARLALGGGLAVTDVMPGSEGAVYATQEGVVLKSNGTLWKQRTGPVGLEQVGSIDSVAMPR